MNMMTQRVNITLSDREVMRLKKLHTKYMEKDAMNNISFTGFCAMILMDACLMIEDGTLEFGNCRNIRKTPGRPKNETLLEAFNKGLEGRE